MPYYDESGSQVLHFGHGDIRVCHGRAKDRDQDDEIVFVLGFQREVGEFHQDNKLAGKSTDEVDAPVRMVFDNVASLDVVIERLTALRAQMNGDGPTRFFFGSFDGDAYLVPMEKYEQWREATMNDPETDEEVAAFLAAFSEYATRRSVSSYSFTDPQLIPREI